MRATVKSTRREILWTKPGIASTLITIYRLDEQHAQHTFLTSFN